MRTFHVCMSVGVNGYITVEAETAEEAKPIAAAAEVESLSLITGDENLDELPHTYSDTYETLVGNVVDPATGEIVIPMERKKRRRKVGREGGNGTENY